MLRQKWTATKKETAILWMFNYGRLIWKIARNKITLQKY